MKRIIIGKWLITIGLAIYVIENIYFGWNELPISESEEIADIITKIFIYSGTWFYFLPILDLYEDAVNNRK